MHGARRVATFCVLTAVLPTLLIIIPLYLRHSLFADVIYHVAESDVFEIRDGISTVFCQEHVLHMNSSFSAYQLNGRPEISNNRKHIRLKKSMRLPDDTLEYWGFYLLSGATVTLKACSRFEGGRILVVRGDRNLRTCGLLEHNLKKGPHLDKEYKQVQVTFEMAAQEVVVKENNINLNIKNISNKNLDKNDETTDEEKIVMKDLNTAEEDLTDDDSEIERLKKFAEKFIEQRIHRQRNITTPEHLHTSTNCKDNKDKNCSSEHPLPHKHSKRHSRRKQQDIEQILKLREELNEPDTVRQKRETGYKLDAAIDHGGNAINYTHKESSMSSFENDLFTCYDGQILVTQAFPPSNLCSDVNFLDKGVRMRISHEVNSDGYYYYIFYSDNDLISNDIHALFDIYKPTFQYFNTSDTKKCVNKTECSFQVSFFSGETVIVEVPTRDGIEHEPDDITQLISVCKPRMLIYMIFPITILFLILGCAFL